MRLIWKKGLNLLGTRLDTGAIEKGHVVWWIQKYPVPRWWGLSSHRVRTEADEVICSAFHTNLWGQCYDLGLLQLGFSRFSNVKCPKNLARWLPEYTEWPAFSISGFFSPLMTIPQSIRLKIWKTDSGSIKNHLHRWIGTSQSPLMILWINATLDEN